MYILLIEINVWDNFYQTGLLTRSKRQARAVLFCIKRHELYTYIQFILITLYMIT